MPEKSKTFIELFSRILVLLFWSAITFFSLLLIRNTIPYFNFSLEHEFIQERLVLFDLSIYSLCFYTHIAAGVFCIGSALLQFSSTILKRRRKVHIWSGRVYVFVVLAIGAPTGMFMSFFAKGSMYERLLFMFMAIAWFFTTFKGLQTVLKKNIIGHKQWMYRSYALALTAVSFRVYHIIFYLFAWDNMANYQISLWISVLGNMLIAEFFIAYRNKKYFKSFIN